MLKNMRRSRDHGYCCRGWLLLLRTEFFLLLLLLLSMILMMMTMMMNVDGFVVFPLNTNIKTNTKTNTNTNANMKHQQEQPSLLLHATSTSSTSTSTATARITSSELSPSSAEKIVMDVSNNNNHNPAVSSSSSSLLSLTYEELSQRLGGTGKAKACWECLRLGIDPIWYYNTAPTAAAAVTTTTTDNDNDITGIETIGQYNNNDDDDDNTVALRGWTRQEVQDHIQTTITKGSVTKLGKKTIQLLQNIVVGDTNSDSDDDDNNNDNNNIIVVSDDDEEANEQTATIAEQQPQQPSSTLPVFAVEERVATVSHISISSDGTTKLLLHLVHDGLEVETVIIPWHKQRKSTLCVSSQVGCKQGCTFCSTGKMGKLRNLSTSEILAQMYWANKVIRLLTIETTTATTTTTANDNHNHNKDKIQLYPIDNCVFMGMGEPADNIANVTKAASIMADRNLFRLAPRKITISTVGPNPDVFEQLATRAPVVLAWSVHASRDIIRKQLVPTTRFSMVELRDGLIATLRQRTKRLRTTMLEIALLDGINDSTEDAYHLVEFCRPFYTEISSVKLTVNLIPWNDISVSHGPASLYRTPSIDRVRAYQKVLADNGILCFIRTTRGDEENSACGQLATSKKNKNNKKETQQKALAQ